MSSSTLVEKTSGTKYRLVTRSDFDGLVCAVLLTEIDLIEEIKFVHPKDMQDGKIAITTNDIITNLPYIPGAYLVFDHHYSEMLRNEERPTNYIIDANAPSAARVVYNYYGGIDAFPNINEEMLIAVDKADSADFTRDEILYPKGWVLLNYLIDPRSGLEQCNEFSTPHYDFMIMLIEACKNLPIDDILHLSDVKERIDLYFKRQKNSLHQIEKNTRIHDGVIILDLRNEKEILVVNRFMIYAMYPECTVSIYVFRNNIQKQRIVLAVGRSIINRSSQINIGELMLRYGGGGHETAGTCQISQEKVESVLQELVEKLNIPEVAPTDIKEHSLIRVENQPARNSETELTTDTRTSQVVTVSSELSARFTVTPISGVTPLQVNLDASSSQVAEGRKITKYHWFTNKKDHINEGVRTTALLSEAGDHTITLRITDDLGQTAADTQIVTVFAERQSPLPAFTVSPHQGPPPLTVILDAGSSVDAQGHPVSDYMWSVEGQHMWGKLATITFTTPGTHLVDLMVTDEQGRTACCKQAVNVSQIESLNPTEIGTHHSQAELKFVGLKDYYHVGEFVTLDLIENLQILEPSQRVDLWIAIEAPDGQTYFMTELPLQPFSIEPKPFKTSLENRVLQYRILEFEVPPSIGGNYSFYAIYNKEGADLSRLLFTQRSNLAFAMTVLSDR